MSDASPLEHPIPVPSSPAPPSLPSSRRYMLLFIFLLATLLLYPFADSSTLGIYLLRVMGSGVILFSIYAVGYRRSLLVFAILLGAPAMAQHIWLLKAANPSVLAMTNIVLSFCFDVFVVCVVLKRIFARDHSNSETIFGALCIYLLVGFSFASLFHLVSVVRPGSFYFDPHANFHAVPQRFDFVYYSFGTITSLGAPGITPVSAHARSLTIVEAILGVLFLAVLVSRLMDAYRPGPSLWHRESRHH
jgi:multisubunit Na+/H+ antiporter MnhC subunit